MASCYPAQTERIVALTLDEREKPDFSSPGEGHLPSLGLTSVPRLCTVTGKPGFCPTLLQPCPASSFWLPGRCIHGILTR